MALGISANALTVAGLVLNGVAGALVGLGALQLGGLLYLLFSSLDFMDGAVARLSATPGSVRAPGPRLGEHTDEVLRHLLGMEQSAVDSLRASRIVR